MRWLVPTAVAAAAGALAAGVFEAVGLGDPVAMVATAGLFAILVVPILCVLGIVIRGLYAAWAPDELARDLTEDGGGMPRLVGWVLVILLGILVLAWVTFQGTWQLATWTAFKPLTVGFLQPVIAVGGVVLVLVVSRPASRLFAAIARRIDGRWRRNRTERRSLLRPAPIFGIAAALALATIYVLWRIVVKPRVGPVDTSVGYAPAIAIVVAIVMHVVWPRIPRVRPYVGTALGGLVAGALVARFGLRRMLIAFGLLQASTNLLYALLAVSGKSFPIFCTAVLVDNLANMMGTAAFVAFLMSVCSPGVSATQFALLTSLSSVGQRVFGPLAANVVDAVDWSGFFAVTSALAIPGLVLAWFVARQPERQPEPPAVR